MARVIATSFAGVAVHEPASRAGTGPVGSEGPAAVAGSASGDGPGGLVGWVATAVAVGAAAGWSGGGGAAGLAGVPGAEFGSLGGGAVSVARSCAESVSRG